MDKQRKSLGNDEQRTFEDLLDVYSIAMLSLTESLTRVSSLQLHQILYCNIYILQMCQ